MPQSRTHRIVTGAERVWSMARIAIAGLWAGVCAAVIGCGSVGHFKSDAPRAVDLSGAWVLNRESSDDPQKVFAKLRPKPDSRRNGDDLFNSNEDTGPPARSGQEGSRGAGRRGQRPPMDYASRAANDAFVRTSVMRTLSSQLARGDQLTIQQQPDTIVFDYGTSVRRFTPGAVSVVSAEWGVADRSSGWAGREFVIEDKPQSGVAVTERYSVSGDGKHLTEDLRLGGGDFPSARLKRVYDRIDRPLPRSFPNND